MIFPPIPSNPSLSSGDKGYFYHPPPYEYGCPLLNGSIFVNAEKVYMTLIRSGGRGI